MKPSWWGGREGGGEVREKEVQIEMFVFSTHTYLFVGRWEVFLVVLDGRFPKRGLNEVV